MKVLTCKKWNQNYKPAATNSERTSKQNAVVCFINRKLEKSKRRGSPSLVISMENTKLLTIGVAASAVALAGLLYWRKGKHGPIRKFLLGGMQFLLIILTALITA